jgi:hypothetical protein
MQNCRVRQTHAQTDVVNLYIRLKLIYFYCFDLHWQSVNILFHSSWRQWFRKNQRIYGITQKNLWNKPKFNDWVYGVWFNHHQIVSLIWLHVHVSYFVFLSVFHTSWRDRSTKYKIRMFVLSPNMSDVGTLHGTSPGSLLQALKLMWASKLYIYMEFDEA